MINNGKYGLKFVFIALITILLCKRHLPMIGGISFLLFGTIASSGIKILIENDIDMNIKRNLMIVSLILVTGVGGFMLKIGTLPLNGSAIATVLGIMLNLVLQKKINNFALNTD